MIVKIPMTKKIVINTCYGGFNLSKQAQEQYALLKGIDPGNWNDSWGFFENLEVYSISRDDSDLVLIVEQLKELAFGNYSELKVVEIPENVDWVIEEYDGAEYIAEKRRKWY